ncbi:hypothetical protein FPV67DRAFT_1663119 [Lyophyllum atratum]|nr:hypothetical protein FPV67DRAFT_1663119 [Lyophyllum atratum]
MHSPSITSSVSNFVSAVAGIVMSLLQSVFAVFQAIFALGADIIHSVLSLGQHLVAMVLDLFQGVFGFVAANIVAIGVLGVGYYIYTQTQARRGRRTGIVQK